MADRKTLRLTLCGLLSFAAVLCVASAFYSEKRVSEEPDFLPAGTTARFEFPSRLRVATYNLHNFRDENRFSEKGKFQYKHPKSEKSKESLYRTILEVRPDVLAVQEVGGAKWLSELASALARRGLAFPYSVCLEGRDGYNRLGILSRVPFSKTIELVAPEKLTRGILGIVVPVAGGNLLHVYNVHLKSKVSSDPDDPEGAERRSREARYVRRLIEFDVRDEKTAAKIPASVRLPTAERRENAAPEFFVLLGDFNDNPGSKPLAALEVGTFARALPAKNEDGGVLTFFNPNRGYFHTFDRIFASPALFKDFYVPGSAKIAEFSWSQTASDHRLVYADFDFTGTLRREKNSPENKK